MKNPRTHGLRRSLACSAATAAISLAAALASASPAAARTVPPHGPEGQQQTCDINVKKKPGLEEVLWTVVLGNPGIPQPQGNCSSQSDDRPDGGMRGDDAGDKAAGPLQHQN